MIAGLPLSFAEPFLLLGLLSLAYTGSAHAQTAAYQLVAPSGWQRSEQGDTLSYSPALARPRWVLTDCGARNPH